MASNLNLETDLAYLTECKNRVRWAELNVARHFVEYATLTNQGKFKEALDLLDGMPKCHAKALMVANVVDRMNGNVEYKNNPLKEQ